MKRNKFWSLGIRPSLWITFCVLALLDDLTTLWQKPTDWLVWVCLALLLGANLWLGLDWLRKRKAVPAPKNRSCKLHPDCDAADEEQEVAASHNWGTPGFGPLDHPPLTEEDGTPK